MVPAPVAGRAPIPGVESAPHSSFALGQRGRLVPLDGPFLMATPIINAPSCGNCKFSNPDNGNFQCRYGPPTANAVFAPTENGGFRVAGVVSIFPVMAAHERCGRWERNALVQVSDEKLDRFLNGGNHA